MGDNVFQAPFLVGDFTCGDVVAAAVKVDAHQAVFAHGLENHAHGFVEKRLQSAFLIFIGSDLSLDLA